MGSDTDTLSQLRSGGVEFFTLSGLILSTLVPAAALNGLGFAFPDYAAVWRAMDGDLGAYIRGQIAKANLVAMDKIWDNGFRQTTTSTKPINGARGPARPEDPRARLADVDVDVQGLRCGAGVHQRLRDVHGAADEGGRRAGEPARRHLASSSCTRSRSICSLTNHMWDGFWFLANRRAWERLPEPIREIAAKHLNAAAVPSAPTWPP